MYRGSGRNGVCYAEGNIQLFRSDINEREQTLAEHFEIRNGQVKLVQEFSFKSTWGMFKSATRHSNKHADSIDEARIHSENLIANGNFNYLPADVVGLICNYLSVTDLIMLSYTNKHLCK